MATPKRLVAKGWPNIPDGPVDELSKEERDWIKVQHPDDYASLVYREREHAKALAEEDAATPKEAPKEAPAKEENKPAAEKAESAPATGKGGGK